MDKAMAVRALNDLEFAKYKSNVDFINLLK
jgi:hypothetical protein